MTIHLGCCAPKRLCKKGSIFRAAALLARRDLKLAAQRGADLTLASGKYEKALADFAQHLDVGLVEAERLMRGGA